MSPEQPNIISDPQSEKVRRGRPAVPQARVLEAAEKLFADAEAPGKVSMDDIAAAAGVGKGTLFRAFGSRDGLLDALFAARLEPWRAELGREGSPIGPGRPPVDRIVAILDRMLAFKMDNPRLLAARETGGANLLAAPHYRWAHGVLRDLIVQALVPPAAADYVAHLLLGGLRVELIDEARASGAGTAQIAEILGRAARQIIEGQRDAGDEAR